MQILVCRRVALPLFLSRYLKKRPGNPISYTPSRIYIFFLFLKSHFYDCMYAIRTTYFYSAVKRESRVLFKTHSRLVYTKLTSNKQMKSVLIVFFLARAFVSRVLLNIRLTAIYSEQYTYCHRYANDGGCCHLIPAVIRSSDALASNTRIQPMTAKEYLIYSFIFLSLSFLFFSFFSVKIVYAKGGETSGRSTSLVVNPVISLDRQRELKRCEL